jgi:hypothetical protein
MTHRYHQSTAPLDYSHHEAELDLPQQQLAPRQPQHCRGRHQRHEESTTSDTGDVVLLRGSEPEARMIVNATTATTTSTREPEQQQTRESLPPPPHRAQHDDRRQLSFRTLMGSVAHTALSPLLFFTPHHHHHHHRRHVAAADDEVMGHHLAGKVPRAPLTAGRATCPTLSDESDRRLIWKRTRSFQTPRLINSFRLACLREQQERFQTSHLSIGFFYTLIRNWYLTLQSIFVQFPSFLWPLLAGMTLVAPVLTLVVLPLAVVVCRHGHVLAVAIAEAVPTRDGILHLLRRIYDVLRNAWNRFAGINVEGGGAGDAEQYRGRSIILAAMAMQWLHHVLYPKKVPPSRPRSRSPSGQRRQR